FCLSSDKYLAEVASVHQIISNVLGEPARISRECRFRCYDLFQKFQHLNNRYENENQFISFQQFHAPPSVSQPISQPISQQVSQQVSQHLSQVDTQTMQSQAAQNIGENYSNNYYENSVRNNIQNPQNEQNIIKLSQKNEQNKKNESEKNTNETPRKPIRDAAAIVAVIIVIVLLFLNYRNDNFNTQKNNFEQFADNNNKNLNTQNIEQPKNNQTETYKTESEIKLNQTPTQNIHKSEQNVIRTVSTSNDELNDEKITSADKFENEESNEINQLNETKITPEFHKSAETQNLSAQPLPLPIFVTNNNIASTPEPQIDPFNSTPPTPITTPSTPTTPKTPKTPTTSKTPKTSKTSTTPETTLQSSKVSAVFPFQAESMSNSDEINDSAVTSTPPESTTTTTTTTTTTLPTANSNELVNPQPLNPPTPKPEPKDVNETEIKFREEKQPETKILDSSAWKMQIPNYRYNVKNINDSENNRNDNLSVVYAGGENNHADTRIVQVNNNLDKSGDLRVENQNGISVTKNVRALGTVLATKDPMVIFTADTSESQWRFESNQFELHANQYVLTSAPFRADINLADDFIIEMIGDSKISVLPSNNGVAAIYIDYGRLIIRASYDHSAAIKQVKSIRICTERGEATVGFNGTKSVAFVDTFAEVSRTPTQADSGQTNSNSTNGLSSEIQVGMNPIIGLLPDPQESISWLPAKQNAPFVTKSDMSIVLTEGRSDRGIIRNHPNWLRRISVPEEGKQIESACMNIFNKKNINLEAALQILLNEKSETIRSFGYRIWGDLGRFDVPLKGRIIESESIQQSLVQYFKEVMKRDAESIQRLTEAIDKERSKK
ncbi:MAG: hypothetical protein LBB88_02965, partial [Planctomycetaceae bacterium]|nr:hypothetical protein [Planctomycetaceae bacterium]